MILIILLVLFVMVLAGMFAALKGWIAREAAMWLGLAALVILGLVVFLVGTGWAVWRW